ncbi:MAG: energy-coupled thiamine transporter ThiT [Clostridia bacterium]|nr:energy-coupled thiamine transporter ThiT [Clostridia bacterium]NCC69403.1 energy-coupled thiamine transporter ThiT [Clostridia bacterium]
MDPKDEKAKNTQNKTVRTISEGAIMVAMSAVLSFLSLRLWPQGGSIDLVMIPVIVFALRRGVGWGLGAGLIYGMLDCIISGGVAYGWQSIILDYAVAYSMVGLAGLLPKKPVAGVILASAARLLVHVISGVVIWGQWMPDEFLGLQMTSVWFYSFLYNGTFMAGNMVLAIVVVAILARNTKLLRLEQD